MASEVAPAPQLPGAFDFPSLLKVADLLPVMVAYADRDLVLRFVNKPLADWMERPRGAMIGKTIRETIGEDAYAVREPLLAAALGGERKFFASEFDHPTRGPLAIQTDYIPWATPVGDTQGVICIIQDVTEQRTAERALRESEERFRRIANQAPVLMWVTRLDRTRDFANDAYVEFVGLPRAEAEKLDWRTRIHPEDHDRIVAESIAGEATRETFTLEGRYLRGDGQYRWLRSTSSPRFGPDGELVGFIGAATDITVAKEAELDLKRQVEQRSTELVRREAQFRAVFEAALEVMVLLEPDGTVLAVNNRREAWRHPDPSKAIGVKLWDSPTMQAYPQHVPIMREGIAKAARGEIFTTEVKMEREGVPTAFLDVSVQPVKDEHGRIIYLLFEARDITELKAAQEQLRQSQKMEALGQLTGGIAHDFNNLLTVVVGGLDLLTKRIADEKLQRYAANALTAAERGARLTGQLLAFSRVQRLEVRPTPVAPLIENMRPLLRNVLGPGIEKKFELDPEPVLVLADPTQLEVAVLNLAINARDAMPTGGVLSFATRKARIAGDAELDDGDYVELAISDTGAGMDEAVLARAFEPFFTTKDVGKGTGLGLSMVYGMARQSGGVARIESEPGKGTCVRLFFRVASKPHDHPGAGESDEHDSAAMAGAESVLVVDDDPDVRAFIGEALTEYGYRVREAADGKAGLSAFAAERPDLVVVDFIMPGLSGADVASRILAKHPDQAILFVSGYSETDSIRRIAPNAPLLTKPFRSEALTKAVRTALRKG
ncbi:MAG TPA: PAS domain-containing protein [Sphingomicrobium sp.]|nr:PAS domain-containing protein [Sphingomicrobium sp.]